MVWGQESGGCSCPRQVTVLPGGGGGSLMESWPHHLRGPWWRREPKSSIPFLSSGRLRMSFPKCSGPGPSTDRCHHTHCHRFGCVQSCFSWRPGVPRTPRDVACTRSGQALDPCRKVITGCAQPGRQERRERCRPELLLDCEFSSPFPPESEAPSDTPRWGNTKFRRKRAASVRRLRPHYGPSCSHLKTSRLQIEAASL